MKRLLARAAALPDAQAARLGRMVDLRLTLLEHRDNAVRLENRRVHLCEIHIALTSGEGAQLRQRDPRAEKRSVHRLAASDQVLVRSVEQPARATREICDPVEALVQDNQRSHADGRAGEGVVGADDRVLDGVRDEEQDNEIERVLLSELALQILL